MGALSGHRRAKAAALSGGRLGDQSFVFVCGSDAAGPGYSFIEINRRLLRSIDSQPLTTFRNIANIGRAVGATEVVFYREEDGSVPLLDCLDGLPRKPREKCVARLVRLEEMGHELRRPEADFLRDGIYELRAAHQRVQYRMLYFFSGKAFVVVSHGL